MKSAFFFFNLFFPLTLLSQYKGGNGSGSDEALYLNAGLGSSIYKGGNDDGFDTKALTAQNLGNSIYKGGFGDGNDLLSISNQTIGNSIFLGGNGDGNDIASVSAQAIGQSIFLGGNGDGSDVRSLANQAIGQSIYKGGNGDGSDTKTQTNQAMGTNIYFGGFGDGSDAKSLNNQGMGQNIFTGGFGDGSESATLTNQGMGESIFLGGFGDGSAMLQIFNTPLPMELLSISAEWQQKDAIIRWQTATEINVDYFEVQLLQGSVFTAIGQVKAVGNSINTQSYFYLHQNPVSNEQVLHYRIKSVDYDGSEQYSPVVSLWLDENEEAEIQLFPNPASDWANLQFDGDLPRRVSLLSNEQKTLESIEPSTNSLELNLKNLSAGTYFILIEFKNEIITKTLIVNP